MNAGFFSLLRFVGSFKRSGPLVDNDFETEILKSSDARCQNTLAFTHDMRIDIGNDFLLVFQSSQPSYQSLGHAYV